MEGNLFNLTRNGFSGRQAWAPFPLSHRISHGHAQSRLGLLVPKLLLIRGKLCPVSQNLLYLNAFRNRPARCLVTLHFRPPGELHDPAGRLPAAHFIPKAS